MGLALNTRPMVCSRSCPSLSWGSPTSPSVTSGGVDPSAVAAMLWAEGHNLVGLTTQFWNPALFREVPLLDPDAIAAIPSRPQCPQCFPLQPLAKCSSLPQST